MGRLRRWLRYLDPSLTFILLIVVVQGFYTRWSDFGVRSERNSTSPLVRAQKIKETWDAMGPRLRVEMMLGVAKSRAVRTWRFIGESLHRSDKHDAG